LSAGELVIVRHADTDWTVSGQHTGRTDLPLNEAGRAKALELRPPLSAWSFAAVFSSPLARAEETARLAGFAPGLLEQLMEWDYGEYEGLTSARIEELSPGWDLWRNGCPAGEDAADVGRRADAVLASLPPDGNVLVFSHGHMLRVLTARWLGLDARAGALFLLAPGSIGILTHEHGRRVLRAGR
jgi:probable phosphoglycerate mutase